MAKQWVMTPARKAYYASKRKESGGSTSQFKKTFKKEYLRTMRSKGGFKLGKKFRKHEAVDNALMAASRVSKSAGKRVSKMFSVLNLGRSRQLAKRMWKKNYGVDIRKYSGPTRRKRR